MAEFSTIRIGSTGNAPKNKIVESLWFGFWWHCHGDCWDTLNKFMKGEQYEQTTSD